MSEERYPIEPDAEELDMKFQRPKDATLSLRLSMPQLREFLKAAKARNQTTSAFLRDVVDWALTHHATMGELTTAGTQPVITWTQGGPTAVTTA